MSELSPWGIAADDEGPYKRVCVFAGGKVHVMPRQELHPDAAALRGGWIRTLAEVRRRPLEIYSMAPLSMSDLSEAIIAFGNAEGLR
jgi:hypothetical protein